MRRLPNSLLEEHQVLVVRDGAPESAWRQVLRLNQSLWRQEQGLRPGSLGRKVLGSALDEESAAMGRNLLSEGARKVARRALSIPAKLIDEKRLYGNLLASQALCFSIFGELAEDLALAGRVLSRLFGRSVDVTRIELEYNPGRGDASYTGDHSAADAYVEYSAGGRRGFLCVEMKYFEDVQVVPEWKDSYRPRYSEVAGAMGCFLKGAEPALHAPPLEQLWRDHLLAGSILLHPNERFDEGYFVVVCPKLNEACAQACSEYRQWLADDRTFLTWTLESVVDALAEHACDDWAWTLRERYLDYYRVDRAIQDHHLRATARWARAVREDLGALQGREGHRVWFRPSSTGFAMIGLLSEKPQLGKSYSSTEKLTVRFEEEFRDHCDGDLPHRSTPEKRLQSYLVRNALANRRRMQALDDKLEFLTDELVMPSIQGDQRLDLLALRQRQSGARVVLIELKSERALTELLRQTRTYAEFLDSHAERLAELAEAILGTRLSLTGPAEKWIVWPAAGDGSDPREQELSSEGVRVVGYCETARGFEFAKGQLTDRWIGSVSWRA